MAVCHCLTLQRQSRTRIAARSGESDLPLCCVSAALRRLLKDFHRLRHQNTALKRRLKQPKQSQTAACEAVSSTSCQATTPPCRKKKTSLLCRCGGSACSLCLLPWSSAVVRSVAECCCLFLCLLAKVWQFNLLVWCSRRCHAYTCMSRSSAAGGGGTVHVRRLLTCRRQSSPHSRPVH